MLLVDVEKQLGDFAIAAKFEAPDGVTALFGPSGSGKTSIVSMVAGLMTPDRGRIMCNEHAAVQLRRRLQRIRRTGAASATCSRTAGCFRT